MKKIIYTLSLGLLLAQTVYAQCDKTHRNKVVFTSLNYFQDSINTSRANILLIDSTQYSGLPDLSIEPDIRRTIPDTSVLADILTGFKNIFNRRVHQTGLNSCPKIVLTSLNTIEQTLADSKQWARFYQVYPGTSGYYTTTEPFIKDNHAIIYIEHFCGSLCGSGYLLFLKYQEDLMEWKVLYIKQIWVS